MTLTLIGVSKKGGNPPETRKLPESEESLELQWFGMGRRRKKMLRVRV